MKNLRDSAYKLEDKALKHYEAASKFMKASVNALEGEKMDEIVQINKYKDEIRRYEEAVKASFKYIDSLDASILKSNEFIEMVKGGNIDER